MCIRDSCQTASCLIMVTPLKVRWNRAWKFCVSVLLNISPMEWDDLTHFEGNANAFRILTHQFEGRRKGGLDVYKRQIL